VHMIARLPPVSMEAFFMQKILMVVVAAVMMWYLLTQQGSAAVQPQAQGDCVDALHAEYAPQWAEMNQVQRAMVGLQAAGCTP
jgi:hypothetical protein